MAPLSASTLTDQLLSDRQRERKAGLALLADVLSWPPDADPFRAKDWQTIGDKFCIFASSERRTAAAASGHGASRGGRGAASTTAPAPLVVGSVLVRLFDRCLATSPPPAILGRLLEHVLETLEAYAGAGGDPDAWQPLRFHYAQALSRLLRVAPLREHLKPAKWDSIFLCLSRLLAPPEQAGGMQADGRAGAADLAESFALLVSGFHLQHILRRSGDILTVIGSHLAAFQKESQLSAYLVGSALFVLVHMGADIIDGCLNALDKLMPAVLNLWTAMSPELKTQVLSISRVFMLLYSVESELNPVMVSIAHRIASCIISDLPFRLSTAAGDLIFDAIQTQPTHIVKGALASHRNVGRTTNVEHPILEIDLAATLLCWQLQFSDELQKNDATYVKVEQDDGESEHTQPKRYRLSIPLLSNEIQHALTPAAQHRQRALALQILAVAATRNWQLCGPLVRGAVPSIVSLLSAKSADVEEAALMVLHVFVSHVELPDSATFTKTPPLLSSTSASHHSSAATSVMSSPGPDAMQGVITSHATASTFGVQDIWDAVFSKLRRAADLAEMRFALLSTILRRKLIRNESKLAQDYRDLLDSGMHQDDRLVSPSEVTFHSFSARLLGANKSQLRRLGKWGASRLRCIALADHQTIGAAQLSALSDLVLLPLGFEPVARQVPEAAAPVREQPCTLPGGTLLLECRLISLSRQICILSHATPLKRLLASDDQQIVLGDAHAHQLLETLQGQSGAGVSTEFRFPPAHAPYSLSHEGLTELADCLDEMVKCIDALSATQDEGSSHQTAASSTPMPTLSSDAAGKVARQSNSSRFAKPNVKREDAAAALRPTGNRLLQAQSIVLFALVRIIQTVLHVPHASSGALQTASFVSLLESLRQLGESWREGMQELCAARDESATGMLASIVGWMRILEACAPPVASTALDAKIEAAGSSLLPSFSLMADGLASSLSLEPSFTDTSILDRERSLLWPLDPFVCLSVLEAFCSNADADRSQPPVLPVGTGRGGDADNQASSSAAGRSLASSNRSQPRQPKSTINFMEIAEYGMAIPDQLLGHIARLQLVRRLRQSFTQAAAKAPLGDLAIRFFLCELKPRPDSFATRCQELLTWSSGLGSASSLGAVADIFDAALSLREDYEFESNELALLLCLDTCTALFPNLAGQHLAGKAADERHQRLATKLTELACSLVKKSTDGAMSTRAQLRLMTLLLAILVYDPHQQIIVNFSPAASLVAMLESSSLVLKLLWARNASACIFETIDPADYDRIFRDILQRLGTEPDDRAETIATCAVLWSVVVASKATCIPAIAAMLRLATPDTASDVSAIVAQLAEHLGFAGSQSLLAVVLEDLLREIGDVRLLPEALGALGTPESDSLAFQVEIIIPYAARQGVLDDYLESLRDRTDALKNRFAYVYGMMLPMTFDALLGEQVKLAIKKVVEACGMSHSELSRELSRNSAAVVLAILSSINSAGDLDELDPAIDPDIRLALAQMQPWVPPPSTHLHGTSIASMAFAQHPLPPKSAAFAAAPPTLGHAMSALEALRSAIGSNAVSDMLRPQRLYKMVHNLHLGLDMDKLPVHRRRLMLNSYRVFLVIAGAHAFHPLIFRTVIQHLLKYAEHEATLGTSCAIMAFLVERAFHTGFKKNLSENLVQLCSSLAKIAVDYQRRAAALSAQAQSPLPGSSSDQQPGFQMPNRPLQSMALADAAVLNWAAESIVALFETVLRLVEGCDGMPIQLALLGVDSENVLFQRLMAKYSPSQIAPEVLKKALLDHPVRSPAPIRHLQRQLDGHGLPGWLAAESLPLLTARLRVLVRSEADPSISSSLRTEAAKCLGKLDALAPNVHSVGDDLLLAPDQRPPTSASPPQCHEGCLVAMRHLIAALFEPNLEIASIASRTLMTVAATADGRAAIQNLSAREASYIDIFQGRGSSARSLAPYQMYTPIAHGALFVDGRTETQWVVEVANSLLASFDYDTFFASLGLMMDMRPELADAILPFLFHLPLFRELLDDQTRVDLPVAKLLSAIVNDFFAQATPADDFAIRKMLRVLHYLGRSPAPGISVQYRWLDLDFSVVAQAAKIVSPLDSLYFIETWRAHTMPKTESVSTGTWRLLMECYSRLGEADGFNGVASLYREGIDEVLVQKYEHDREWSKIIATQDARLQRVARSGLSAASEPHSAATAHGEQIHLLKALSRSGQHHIIEMYLNGVSYSAEKSARNSDESQPDDSGSFLTQDLAEFHFESLWRMGRWDKTNTQGKSKHTSGTNQRFFECLRSLHEAPCARATAALIQGSLVEFTNEDCRFPESLCVIEASETQTILNDGHAGFNKLLDRWSSRLSQLSELRPFDELEKVLAFRTQLLSSVRRAWANTPHRTERIERALSEHLLQFAQLALSHQGLDAGRAALQQLDEMASMLPGATLTLPKISLTVSGASSVSSSSALGSSAPSAMWLSICARVQHIKLHWLQGDQGIAIGLLKDLISSNMTFFKEPRVESRALHADLLCLLGKWSSKTQTLNPQLIVREYLLPAVKLREAINEIHRQQRLEAPGTDSKEYYRLAQYCDEILEEMSADETQKHAAQLVLEREQELEQLKILERSAGKGQAGAAAAGPAANAAAIERFKRKLVKQLELDRAEVSRWRHEMSVYLKLSVRNYMMALIHASKHSEETVFRFCSLWFSYSQSESLQETVAQLIDSVPTRKFLILMYQISARFSSSSSAPSTPASALSQAASPATQRMHDDSNAPGRRSGQHKVEANFDKLLEHLILRIVCDYPHHSLPHLVALKNGGASSSRSAGRTSSSKTTAEAAPNMAKMILNKLAAVPIGQGTSHGVSVHSIATNLDYLFHLYIQVANFKHDKTISRDRNAKTFAFDSRMMIAQFEANSQIPVLTHEQPVGGARDYSGIVYITGFEPTYSLPGGINVPKVVQCTGSDGKRYRQLVKGHDDLRQDAVLSSVFNMVNILLLKNFETRKRKLHIRTYKIIPLSPQAGVVQWVDGTVPIGSLLLDAHTRYREGDLSLLECRSLMMAEHERPTSDPASKLAVYRTIEQRFRPAFSLAFLEMFPDPRTWFENRTRFTQSLAASSMAGYIVGLGDRHAQNILFDRQSAELIHIDLGIAFDQGKLLSVPELVPFRLTRDLEDCIGITGVEGQFRRGCEETMRVLRNESHAISMLLDVFRHDPLYNWRISPLKMRKLQHKQAHPVGASGETEQATAQPGRAPRGSRGRSSAATAVHDATSGAVADLEEAIGAAAGAGVGAAPDTRGNEEAERALFGVRKKLSSTLSVECQVSQLISAASDPGNLSRLFPGWQPWL